VLFDPRAHEPLVETPWDPAVADAAVREIASDARTTRRGGEWWPWHPLDVQPDDPEVVHGVYLGAAGVLLALRLLGDDVTSLDEEVLESYRRRPEFGGPLPSLWMGEGGIRLVAGDGVEDLAVVPADDSLELMWGSPGMLVLADQAGADPAPLVEHLLAHWGEQEYIGAAHGVAGAIAALGPRCDARAAGYLAAHAVWEDGLVNWPPRPGEPITRTQWCHGAPGVVCSAAGLPRGDELDALLLAGGELTWAAGPLRKGASLCHGTAGNGCAFLKLFMRTGDELWLDRARRFAMHAAAQVESARSEYGRGRYTLWTGDLGVAVYLQQCAAGESGMPGLDLW
jgi:hypothetical protein